MKLNSIHTLEAFELLSKVEDNSVDLFFSDLPYGISRDSGYVNNSPDKKDYIAKYGKHTIDFGDWDTKEVDLNLLTEEVFRILKPTGRVVIFYDIWGAESVKNAFKKFKQPRIMEWVKNNPVPINSKLNFLSNAKEYMFSFVKKSKPVFNGSYHKGVFEYPLCHGLERTKHPTQKPLALIKDILELTTNEGDVVVDPFCGSGTTAVACVEMKRNYIVGDACQEYTEIAFNRISDCLISIDGC